MLQGQHLAAHITLDGGITDCGVDTALRVTDERGHVVVDGSAGAPYALALDAIATSALSFHVRALGRAATSSFPSVSAIDAVRIELQTREHFGDDRDRCSCARSEPRVASRDRSFGAQLLFDERSDARDFDRIALCGHHDRERRARDRRREHRRRSATLDVIGPL